MEFEGHIPFIELLCVFPLPCPKIRATKDKISGGIISQALCKQTWKLTQTLIT